MISLQFYCIVFNCSAARKLAFQLLCNVLHINVFSQSSNNCYYFTELSFCCCHLYSLLSFCDFFANTCLLWQATFWTYIHVYFVSILAIAFLISFALTLILPLLALSSSIFKSFNFSCLSFSFMLLISLIFSTAIFIKLI